MSPTIGPAARWRSAFSEPPDGLAPPWPDAYVLVMPAPFKTLTFALAALMVLGTLDSASARKKKARTQPQSTAGENQPRHVPGQLVPVDRDGTPIIMQGYRSPAMTQGDKELKEPEQTVQRADRPVKIPRGSSTYIPPPSPSPYSSSSPPAAALTQPTVQPYHPPPITTFSDKVNDAIHAYPLQKGIGNNPLDQQQFIRQRINQP